MPYEVIIGLLITVLLFSVILLSFHHILSHLDKHNTVENKDQAEPQQTTLNSTPSKEAS